MVDKKKMRAGLEGLTGYDFEEAEKAARMGGDMTPDVSFSKDFQARIAAKAAGVSVDEIKKLNIKEFTEITSTVNNFLFESLAETVKAQRASSGK